MDEQIQEIIAHLDKKLIYDFNVEKFCKELIEENLKFRKVCSRGLKDTDRLIKAIWALSGSGTYYKKLLPVKTDQVNRDKSWYYFLDRSRLNYVSKLNKGMLENFKFEPAIFYNGRNVQNKDLLRAISEGKLSIKKENLYLIDGCIRSTLQQIQNFSFPVKLKSGKKMAILSNTAHFSRILRYMANYKENFDNVKVVLLPVCLNSESAEDEMMKNEIKGILESVAKKTARMEAYPYEIAS